VEHDPHDGVMRIVLAIATVVGWTAGRRRAKTNASVAWLEKQEADAWRVCVVEQRGLNVWERVARGKRNGRGRVRLVAEAATESEADAYATIDPTARLDVPDDRETSQELIDADGGTWPGFLAELRGDAAWRAAEDLSCIEIELVDDEID
jgi:hypothetical protein